MRACIPKPANSGPDVAAFEPDAMAFESGGLTPGPGFVTVAFPPLQAKLDPQISRNFNHKPHEQGMSYFHIYGYAGNHVCFHTNHTNRRRKTKITPRIHPCFFLLSREQERIQAKSKRSK
jgi:hypothetical protein